MHYIAKVNIYGLADDLQPDPFAFDSKFTNWEILYSLLTSMVDISKQSTPVNIYYWDDEDYVSLKSQADMDEATRLARATGVVWLFVCGDDSSNLAVPPAVTGELHHFMSSLQQPAAEAQRAPGDITVSFASCQSNRETEPAAGDDNTKSSTQHSGACSGVGGKAREVPPPLPPPITEKRHHTRRHERKTPCVKQELSSGYRLWPEYCKPGKGDRKKKKHLTVEFFLRRISKLQSQLRKLIVHDLSDLTSQQCSTQTDQRNTTSSTVYHQFACDHCGMRIVGSRYKCGNCPNYNLCEECEDLCPPVHNVHHAFIKLRLPCVRAGRKRGMWCPLLRHVLYCPLSISNRAEDNGRTATHDSCMAAGSLDEEEKKCVKGFVPEIWRKTGVDLPKQEAEACLIDFVKGADMRVLGAGPSLGQLSAAVLSQETIPESGQVLPGQVLVWKVRLLNDGCVPWPRGTALACRETTALSAGVRFVKQVHCQGPNHTAMALVIFTVPTQAGRYSAAFSLCSDGTTFGQVLSCHVDVMSSYLNSGHLDHPSVAKASDGYIMPFTSSDHCNVAGIKQYDELLKMDKCESTSSVHAGLPHCPPSSSFVAASLSPCSQVPLMYADVCQLTPASSLCDIAGSSMMSTCEINSVGRYPPIERGSISGSSSVDIVSFDDMEPLEPQFTFGREVSLPASVADWQDDLSSCAADRGDTTHDFEMIQPPAMYKDQQEKELLGNFDCLVDLPACFDLSQPFLQRPSGDISNGSITTDCNQQQTFSSLGDVLQSGGDQGNTSQMTVVGQSGREASFTEHGSRIDDVSGLCNSPFTGPGAVTVNCCPSSSMKETKVMCCRHEHSNTVTDEGCLPLVSNLQHSNGTVMVGADVKVASDSGVRSETFSQLNVDLRTPSPGAASAESYYNGVLPPSDEYPVESLLSGYCPPASSAAATIVGTTPAIVELVPPLTLQPTSESMSRVTIPTTSMSVAPVCGPNLHHATPRSTPACVTAAGSSDIQCDALRFHRPSTSVDRRSDIGPAHQLYQFWSNAVSGVCQAFNITKASHRNSADGVGVVFVPSGTHSAAREECSCGDVLPVHFQSAVNHMMEMGFFDQPRIVRLLHKHGGDEQMVVDELCRQGGATAEAD